MKGTILTILVLIGLDFNDIAKINNLKEEAENAYTNGDFQSAFESYKMLVDSFKISDDMVLMNYANAAYALTGLKDKIDNEVADSDASNYADAAMTNYQKLTNSRHHNLRSSAYNQIGVINYHLGNSVQKGDKYLSESLSYFKQSLKSDSRNDNARYNYELVKKKLQENQEQQENQDQDKENQDQDQQNEDQDKQNEDQQNQNQEQQDQQNQEQQNQDQQNQDQQDQDQQNQENQEEQQSENGEQEEKEQQQEQQQQEGENGEQQEEEAPQSPSDKFKEMNISEDMAKMILEALRNNEVQYLQQQKRKPTKRADSSKPDW